MIAPSAIPFLAVCVVILMAATGGLWAASCATTIWIILVRPAYVWWLAALAGAVATLWLLLLHVATSAWLPASASVLTVWATPLVAVPALNLVASTSRRTTDPVPIADKDGKLSWRTVVFDIKRAKLRTDYEPPPLVQDEARLEDVRPANLQRRAPGEI